MKAQEDTKVQKAMNVYSKIGTVVLLMTYTGLVMAQAMDTNMGPFGPICVVSRWFASLVIPIATIAFLVAAGSFIWGEELVGMSKKTVNIIIAVCIAFGGGAIVSWLASRFGFTASCSGSGFGF
jgi:type IV secretion system protein VirB2